MHAFDHNYKRDPSIPYFKIKRTFYFGGMKKEILIPISMPNRVIIEPNAPRQGYSKFTWKGLNEYYLQKCMSKEEYIQMLDILKNIGFKVYSIYREESRFLADTFFDTFSKVVWAVCIATAAYLLITEIKDKPDDPLISVVLVGISILLVMSISIYNFFQSPNSNIFINYEDFMHQSIQKYFGQLNATIKNGLRFNVSANDINWIEITIPKSLQMPFSESVVKSHLDIITHRNVEKEIAEIAKLVAIVDTVEEADAINLQIINQRPYLGSNQTHNLASGYGSEDVPLQNKAAKIRKARPETNSDDYEDEDEVQSLNQKSISPPIGYEIIGDLRRISRLSQAFRPGKISGITNVMDSTFKRSGILDIPTMSERDSDSRNSRSRGLQSYARDLEQLERRDSMLEFKHNLYLAKQSQATINFNKMQSIINSKLTPRERIIARMQQKQYLEGESSSLKNSKRS